MNKNNWYIKGSEEFAEFIKKREIKNNKKSDVKGNCGYYYYFDKIKNDFHYCRTVSGNIDLITIEELNKMYFPVLFTIEDLAQGKCALEFDRENDNLEDLNKILRKAFPKDGYAKGVTKYYIRCIDSKWDGNNYTNLPTQKLSEFLKELNMKTKEITGYKLLKDLPNLKAGHLFVRKNNNWSDDPYAANEYFYTDEEIIKLTEWFEPQYEEQFKIDDWVITTTNIFKEKNKSNTGEVFQITEILGNDVYFDRNRAVDIDRIRIATQEEVRNFKQSQEIKLGDYVVEFKSGGIKVHNQHYPKTYLEQVKDILSTNYVHSIKFGCTGEYILTLNDVNKILERLN